MSEIIHKTDDRHADDCKCPECFDGKCTNTEPVFSTPKGAVYRSECNDDCQNCEYWVEVK